MILSPWLPRRREKPVPHWPSAVTHVPLAVLDVAPVSEGSTVRHALQNTIDLARWAEAWGYRRYWVAEQHFVAVGSASPAVLIGLIAAATNEIRVGSAAVQVGHHTAAAVVECDSMRSSSGTPGSISPRYASSSVPPLIPEKCVVTKTSSGPGSDSATAATRT